MQWCWNGHCRRDVFHVLCFRGCCWSTAIQSFRKGDYKWDRIPQNGLEVAEKVPDKPSKYKKVLLHARITPWIRLTPVCAAALARLQEIRGWIWSYLRLHGHGCLLALTTLYLSFQLKSQTYVTRNRFSLSGQAAVHIWWLFVLSASGKWAL